VKTRSHNPKSFPRNQSLEQPAPTGKSARGGFQTPRKSGCLRAAGESRRAARADFTRASGMPSQRTAQIRHDACVSRSACLPAAVHQPQSATPTPIISTPCVNRDYDSTAGRYAQSDPAPCVSTRRSAAGRWSDSVPFRREDASHSRFSMRDSPPPAPCKCSSG